MHQKGWPVNCMTIISVRWWSKHAIPKTAEVTYSVGHLWEVIVCALNYYITQYTGNSIRLGIRESENDAVEKTALSRELGPRASGWAAQENGKETQLRPIEWGSICCSSVRSPTPSPKQPFQIKWEVYFSKELCRSSLLSRRYDFACICVCMVGHGYTTKWLLVNRIIR